ncbi:hypothetical protein ACYULU_06865 [Breznakiellaceae bacterium SP9]
MMFTKLESCRILAFPRGGGIFVMMRKYGMFVSLVLFAYFNAGAQEVAGYVKTKAFGSYEIPSGWVEVTQMTRGQKYFYTLDSSQQLRLPTNISIEMGRNPYTINAHTTFRYAILRQLAAQAGPAQVNGSGTFTNNGYPLYLFTIEDKGAIPKCKTVQYYIIGERRHILVHLTDYHNDTVTNAEELTLQMVNSFKWPD